MVDGKNNAVEKTKTEHSHTSKGPIQTPHFHEPHQSSAQPFLPPNLARVKIGFDLDAELFISMNYD